MLKALYYFTIFTWKSVVFKIFDKQENFIKFHKKNTIKGYKIVIFNYM
jgi:uncharacterized membrane protein